MLGDTSLPPAAPRPLRRLLTPFERFFKTESAGGIVLVACALLAFLWANSPWSGGYLALQELPVGADAAGLRVEHSLLFWVNDGLMALFFFVVGLEIKREFLVGELAGARRAALPIAGALGGMVVPALIYLLFARGTPFAVGWGVPMATDIAFAVGVMALLGSRVPHQLRVFLLALAIVDDLGAVLVIALFYTANLHVLPLAIALALWLFALLVSRELRPPPALFAVIGVLMWHFTHESGVHATIAGVLLALAVPAGRGDANAELERELKRSFGTADIEAVEVRLDQLERVIDRVQSPLHEWEHTLQPWVAYAIMPVFALVNAGVVLDVPPGHGLLSPAGLAHLAGQVAGSPATLGVLFGLVVGKPVGIVAAAGLAVLSGLAERPRGVGWAAFVGTGMLAGIGFTMSIFIANLAFGTSHGLVEAKLGVLTGSIVAGIAGYALLTTVLPRSLRHRPR